MGLDRVVVSITSYLLRSSDTPGGSRSVGSLATGLYWRVIPAKFALTSSSVVNVTIIVCA